MNVITPAVAFLGAASAACLALAGCAPPYIEALDKSAALTRQMTLVGTIGPTSIDNSAVGVRFFPVKPTAPSLGSVSIQAGFTVWDAAGQESLSFLSAGNSQAGSSSLSFSLTGADPNYPLYEYDVTATLSNQASLLVFKYDPAASTSTYQQYVAPLPGGPMSAFTASASLTNSILLAQTIIGGWDMPPAPGVQDTFAFLSETGGVFSIGTSQLNGSATAFPAGGASTAITASLPGITRSLYYFNSATGASIASYFFAAQWNCLQWVGSGASTAMTGVTHRIDAVLSTGDLLSTEGGTLRLYDSTGTGTQVLAVPLNGLQFCYEAYIGSTPYAFFALAMPVSHGDWAFNVYAIPTSALRSL